MMYEILSRPITDTVRIKHLQSDMQLRLNDGHIKTLSMFNESLCRDLPLTDLEDKPIVWMIKEWIDISLSYLVTP